jgi:hypothetical protein
MCEQSRVNINFVDTIRCEEGTRLYNAMIETRQAYIYHPKNDEQSQELYNRYDQAKAAFDQHIAESQGLRSF